MKQEQKAAIMVAIQANFSPFLWGDPGQGKSSVIRLGLPKLGYTVLVLRVNTILPHQLHGCPAPDPSGQFTKTLAPEWVEELNKADKSVLFLDDISAAPTSNQTATLGIFDERKVGGIDLKAIPVGAANPDSLSTARFNMDAAAANRGIHVQITSDAESFRRDARANFPPPPVPELRSNWMQLAPTKEALITDFLCSQEGQHLVNKKPDHINMKTVAYPTERSWKMAWELLAACDSINPASMEGVNLLKVREMLFCGAVGEGAFAAFNQYYLEPIAGNVEEALKHGKAYSYPETGDQMFALLTAVAQHLSSVDMKKKQWDQAWSLLEGAWKTQHRDRAVTFALDLLSLNTTKQFKLPKFYTDNVDRVLNEVL